MRIACAAETALRIWRNPSIGHISGKKRVALPNDFKPSLRLHEVQWLIDQFGIELPACSLVTDGDMRRNSSKLHCLTLHTTFPQDAFVHVGKEFYLASPELVLSQIAGILCKRDQFSEAVFCSSHTQRFAAAIVLACLICEFCGTYRLDSCFADGFTQATPLTSVSKLQAFLAQTGPFPGRQAFANALGLSLEGSASPSETALCLFATLPSKFGGMGLRTKPRLNPSIATMKGGKKETRYPDELWEHERIIVEYNGSYHEGERANKDDQRRNELAALGYSVFVVNAEQLHSPNLLEETFRAICEKVGLAGRKPGDYAARRNDMRALVFEALATRCAENRHRLVNPVILPRGAA